MCHPPLTTIPVTTVQKTSLTNESASFTNTKVPNTPNELSLTNDLGPNYDDNDFFIAGNQTTQTISIPTYNKDFIFLDNDYYLVKDQLSEKEKQLSEKEKLLQEQMAINKKIFEENLQIKKQLQQFCV